MGDKEDVGCLSGWANSCFPLLVRVALLVRSLRVPLLHSGITCTVLSSGCHSCSMCVRQTAGCLLLDGW